MKIRFAKNIAIITIDTDDVASSDFNMLDLFDSMCGDLKVNGIKNAYKVHIFINENDIARDSTLKLDRLRAMIDMMKDVIRHKKIYIHSVCSFCSSIPEADNLWTQNFDIDDSHFISVRKQNNKLNIVKYKKYCYY